MTRSLGGLAREMHRAFHAEQQELQALTVCHCDACAQTGDLSVKIVAHVGEVAEQEVRGRVSLAGVDVILVHRMLKNSVPVPEYVLMTETAYNACEPFVREHGTEIEEELEGLGTERLWFVDIGQIAAEPEPVPQATKGQRAAHATSSHSAQPPLLRRPQALPRHRRRLGGFGETVSRARPKPLARRLAAGRLLRPQVAR